MQTMFTIEPLPYLYTALAPHIDEQTLHFHHDKHFQTYADNLNRALENHPQYFAWSLERLLTETDSLEEEIRLPVKNNAGGVYNHALYFRCMGPGGGGAPKGKLGAQIDTDFGSFDRFKSQFKQAALTQFGSGWAWLTAGKDGRLAIEKTGNQDTPPLSQKRPILLVDVWEHAYYLQYQNRRADYVDGWFETVDWEAAEKRFLGQGRCAKGGDDNGTC